MRDKEKKLSQLSPLQCFVTQENGTEKPFDNEYWDFFDEGLYLDIVSGEVLFSSLHKFESHCGWPSFYKAIGRENIVELVDLSHGMRRVEVRSQKADSHLGHLFTDGPAPTGVRYCINSAALKFVPLSDLKSFGLESYDSHFEQKKYPKPESIDFATFGAGCFWGVEAIFRGIDGVFNVTSGYSGGRSENPTYREVCTGESGHAEVVQIEFDPANCSYENLLDTFFRLHDPTTLNRQGADVGTQYRSVIYYHNENQKEFAQKFIEKLEVEKKFSMPIVTEVSEFQIFYPAEDYHQDYYSKKYGESSGPICHYLRGV